jgi:hypothetical protein
MPFMRIILFFFIFSFLQLNSQIRIKGTIKDSLQNPVSLVNVLLYNKLDNSLIDFKQSSNLGYFELVCHDAKAKSFLLKAFFLGYKPFFFEFSTDGNSSIIEKNIVLKDTVVTMREVIVKADFRDVTEKNDTIAFNLKRLLNGSEQKLKDVLKKLPGLSIDDNGKIKYKGKKIDDLLIEGDEFYGKQHQLATENLKSEMIEKIEVLKNFQNLSSITGFNNTGRMALNVSIKETYKNTIKGDVEIDYGYKKRYRQHNNIYNFASKTKVNFISDNNNTNNLVFTVNDYLELKKGVQHEILNETTSSSVTIDENLPSFLFSTDNVNKKDVQFYSVNFSDKISKTSKVQGFSMLNYVKQSEFIKSKQFFFADDNIVIDKKLNSRGTLLFNTNKIQFESKPNERNYYNYILSINYNKDNQSSIIDNQSISDQTNFDENKGGSSANIGQFFTHKIKLNNNYLFEYNLFNDFTSLRKTIDLESNDSFLNLNFNDDFVVFQKTEGYVNSFGINSKLTIKSELGTFSVNAGSSNNTESLRVFVNEFNPEFNSELNLLNTKNHIGISFSKKRLHKFNSSFGFKLVQAQFQCDSKKENNLIFLPFVNFSYEVSKKTNISLNYKRDFSNISIDKVMPGLFIEDYRTIIKKGAVFYDALLPKNTISLNGTYTNLQTNFISFFGLVYTNKVKEIGFNFINTNNLSIRQYDFIDLDDSSYLFFTLEKKMKSIPWSVKFETLQSYSNRESFVNDLKNTFSTVQNKAEISFLSYFKSNDFNMNFGAEYLVNNSENNSNKVKNALGKTTAFLKLNGLVLNEKLNWELDFRYIYFSSNTTLQKYILEINPGIQYKFKNWNFAARGVNILNIRDNNVRFKVDNQNSYFEQAQFSSLSGFVNLGLSFSF